MTFDRTWPVKKEGCGEQVGKMGTCYRNLFGLHSNNTSIINNEYNKLEQD